MSFALTDGPDGSTDQAIAFDGTAGMKVATDPVDVDSSFAFWFQAQETGDNNQVYVNLGSVGFKYDPDTGTFEIIYADGTQGETPVTDYSTGWHLSLITFDVGETTTEMTWYVDGDVVIQTTALQSDRTLDYSYVAYDGTDAYNFDFFDFQQWGRLKEIADLDTYQAAVLANPDTVLPPE